MSDWEVVRCGFCRYPRKELSRLVAGPAPEAAICDVCLIRAAQLLTEEEGGNFKERILEALDKKDKEDD